MIVLDRVAATLGGRRILDGVSLTVQPGRIVCLFGPSGCGKTTVLNVAAGLVHPDGGRVEVQAARMGYGFQDDRLVPWLDVRENLCLGLAGHYEPEDAEERADLWLERLGLADAVSKRPGELSGGMRRRANLARALAVEPDVLLLDEPFAFLDGAMIEVVQRYVAELRERATILIVSHVREHVEKLGAEIVPVTGPPLRVAYP